MSDMTVKEMSELIKQIKAKTGRNITIALPVEPIAELLAENEQLRAELSATKAELALARKGLSLRRKQHSELIQMYKRQKAELEAANEK